MCAAWSDINFYKSKVFWPNWWCWLFKAIEFTHLFSVIELLLEPSLSPFVRYKQNNLKRIKLLIHKIFLTIVYCVSLLSFSGNDNGDGGLNWCLLQRYTYRVLQTIQMKLIHLCVWPTERKRSLDASIFIQTQQTVPHMKAEIFS